MKKLTLLLVVTFFSFKSHSQLYQKDLQLGLSAGTVFGTSGIGLQAMSELKVFEYVSISYRALASDAMLFTGSWFGSKSYREQSIMVGFHVPLPSQKHQLFFKVGPGYFKQTTSAGTLLYSDSNTQQGKATAFETGLNYEHKAMDLQFMITYASSAISSEMPVNLGIRIGIDPLYWILPKKEKQTESL